MARLKGICARLGHGVSGSDLCISGHSANNVVGADMVVYTSAASADNVELAEARRRGIPCVTRAELLGAIAADYERVIAVAGTHGKTTVCAMLAEALKSFKLTTHIGGETEDRDDGGIFLTEACEYRRSFLSLSPDIGVILNAEWDHPDCYENEEKYVEAFYEFAEGSELLIVNGDDARLSGIVHKNKITFGLARGNDFYAREQEGGFSVWYRDIYIGEVSMPLRGTHNVRNALAAVTVALTLGLSVSAVSERLASFRGVKRRMEKLGIKRGRTLFSDYAHHPTEIRASLSVFDKPPVVFFEPHTYSRTRAYLGDFVKALSAAAMVLLLPVYAAREQGDDGVAQELFSKLKTKTQTVLLSGYDELDSALERFTSEGDEVIFMGAGSIDGAARRLLHA